MLSDTRNAGQRLVGLEQLLSGVVGHTGSLTHCLSGCLCLSVSRWLVDAALAVGLTRQPYSPTALQPYSPTALQPYSPTALQPYSPTALQAYSPTSYSPIALQAYSLQPYRRTGLQPSNLDRPHLVHEKSCRWAVILVNIQASYSGQTKPPSLPLQPYSPTALQPYSPTALQPYSPTALQPYSPTALQAYSPTALQPYSLTALQPYSPTGLQPSNLDRPQLGHTKSCRIALQPYRLTALQAYSPTSLQPYSPTALQPYSPTALQPYSPTALQPYSPTALHPTALQPYSPTALQPYSPTALHPTAIKPRPISSRPHKVMSHSLGWQLIKLSEVNIGTRPQYSLYEFEPYSPTALQPYSPTALQPYSPTSYSPTALQPYSPTALQPYSPTALQPYRPTGLQASNLDQSHLVHTKSCRIGLGWQHPYILQPYSPTALQPYSPTALQPYSPTALQPYSPTALQPYILQPYSPTALQPYSPTALQAYRLTGIEPGPTSSGPHKVMSHRCAFYYKMALTQERINVDERRFMDFSDEDDRDGRCGCVAVWLWCGCVAEVWLRCGCGLAWSQALDGAARRSREQTVFIRTPRDNADAQKLLVALPTLESRLPNKEPEIHYLRRFLRNRNLHLILRIYRQFRARQGSIRPAADFAVSQAADVSELCPFVS
ncbi:hypothetical protein EGW08_008557 [Elysia chlorotica]|uniref:Uncharacterized protein n=1 Tax=Elysia chlorotica TaxID=188477 RepID=A0A433TQ37_ELYCH|nr:hypothetical protein EGW08_008557 [Elysia chlorotica]